MAGTRENLMAELYEQAKGKPFSELMRLYWEKAEAIGFGDTGIVMSTLYIDLIDLLYEEGDHKLHTQEDVLSYKEHCQMKRMIK